MTATAPKGHIGMNGARAAGQASSAGGMSIQHNSTATPVPPISYLQSVLFSLCYIIVSRLFNHLQHVQPTC